MKCQLSVSRVADVRLGADVSFDAWWYTFLAENNMEYDINPADVAGAEQVRFMVQLEPNQVYVPCADVLFFDLLRASSGGTRPASLRKAYAGAWRLTVSTIRKLTYDGDPAGDYAWRRRMLLFCRHRLLSSLAQGSILPSRLVKRLLTTVQSLNGREDPWAADKQAANAAMADFLRSPLWRACLGRLPAQLDSLRDTASLRHALDLGEVARLVLLAAHGAPSLPPDCPSPEAFCARAAAFEPLLDQVLGGGRRGALTAPSGTSSIPSGTTSGASSGTPLDAPRTLLLVGDSDSGGLADVLLARALVRQGWRVVLACKDMPLFTATTFWDVDTDPVLADALRGAHRVHDLRLSKNEMLRRLSGHRFLVINDGTGELLNLYRTSLTFARAWKESDVILVKGRRQAEQMLGSSNLFTRDILCFWQDRDATPQLRHIPRALQVVRFGEADLIAHAEAIITRMRRARSDGRTVMFYSCIIGSIPGQIDTAVEVATTFVNHLRNRLDQVLIINPAEHFEPGMDADDLMFMWERVQRSGLIQTWRFQAVDDVEQSFALMGRKVPPVWAGKDATFSTGCTKELHIALDMQRTHPEMQILGPAVDKFFRRGEYGVGKFYDVSLA